MKIIGISILLLSAFVSAEEYPACDISKSKEISFRNSASSDVLEVSIKGSPCYEAKLNISIKSIAGEMLYLYESKYKQQTSIHWAEPDLDHDAENFAQYVLDNAITSSSVLPDVFKCELEEIACDVYEKNMIPMQEYIAIKKRNVPMLNHSTYYEGWASFIYDEDKKETVKVLEGGV